MEKLLVLFGGFNLITFWIYGLDKSRAKRNGRRIPERILLGLAILGGAAGAYLGMRLYHHKTKKKKFKYGVPFILLLQIGIFLCLKYLNLE